MTSQKMEAPRLLQHRQFVADEILRGKVVPFLGAGINLCERPQGVEWEFADLRYLPSGGELAEYLARHFRYPGTKLCDVDGCPRPKPELDLARVSQYGDTFLGTGQLYEELRSLFGRKYRPTDAHHFLASLCSPKPQESRPEDRYPLIVTTNYDDLMEQALEESKHDFDLIFYDPDDQSRGRFWHKPPGRDPASIGSPNEYSYPFFEQRAVVLKIHGTIDRSNEEHESFVITEDHYIEYLAEEPLERLLPPRLIRKLRTNHLLFLGYSLRDWNLRVFLRRLRRSPKTAYKSWAVLVHAEDAEQQFWLKNDVEIVLLALDKYVGEIRQELLLRAGRSASG